MNRTTKQSSRQYPFRTSDSILDNLQQEVNPEVIKKQKEKELKHAEACRIRYHKRRAKGLCGVSGCKSRLNKAINKRSKKSLCRRHRKLAKQRRERNKNNGC